jgi:hypothetical protein
MVTVYEVLCGRKANTQRGAAAKFPNGIVYDTAIAMQYDHLPLQLGRTPVASVCGSNPLQCIPSTPVTITHVPPGKDLQVTLRDGRGVGFIGSDNSPNKTQKPYRYNCSKPQYAAVTYNAYKISKLSHQD